MKSAIATNFSTSLLSSLPPSKNEKQKTKKQRIVKRTSCPSISFTGTVFTHSFMHCLRLLTHHRAELSKCHGNGVIPKYLLSCPSPKRSLVMEELLSKSRASEWFYGGVTLTLFSKDHSGCYVEKTLLGTRA